MKPNKKYKASNGTEYCMMPFTRYIRTQGPNEWSHTGCMANDVVNESPSKIKAPFYAPATVKCMAVYPAAGQSWWQTVNEVYIKKGTDPVIVNFMFAHDDSLNCYQGQIVSQGCQLGNMGSKGIGTGIHTHVQVSIGKYQTWGHIKGYFNFDGINYPCYGFTSETLDLDDVFFVDDTEILSSGEWSKINYDIKSDTFETKTEAVQQKQEEKWLDTHVKSGDTVKSISLKISGYRNGMVLVKNLGGWIPQEDLTESPDTGDGVCDGVLSTDAAKVYLSPVTVEKIDPANDWVRVHGYWVPARYLLVKK